MSSAAWVDRYYVGSAVFPSIPRRSFLGPGIKYNGLAGRAGLPAASARCHLRGLPSLPVFPVFAPRPNMILVLDNYDSFTYNLVQRLGEIDPGVDLQVVRNDKISVDEIRQLGAERILISPGPCSPSEAGISVEIVQRLAGEIPILGVCLGHQSIGQALGGRIVRAPSGGGGSGRGFALSGRC